MKQFPASDVDVALLAPLADLLEIAARLSQASGLEVDVISLADPGVPLLDELLRDAIVLYEARPGAYARLGAQWLVAPNVIDPS